MTATAPRTYIYPLATAAAWQQPQPQRLIDLLERHLPHSLPLLRRLQFAARFEGGCTPWSHAVLVVDGDGDGWLPQETDANASSQLPSQQQPAQDEYQKQRESFAAAYIDLSRRPETQCWLYCTLEDRCNNGTLSGELLPHHGNYEASTSAAAAIATKAEVAILRSLFAAIRRISETHDSSGDVGAGPALWPASAVLVGALHGTVRAVFQHHCLEPGQHLGNRGGLHVKWLIPVAGLPDIDVDKALESALGDSGWSLGVASRDDIRIVLSRTKIPRQERTMVKLPSTVMRLADGTPIAWAFLGPDGSISSLHCEEGFRRKGIARAAVVKLLREQHHRYSDDGLCSADVTPENESSNAVCRSLNGKPAWYLDW